MPESTRIFYEGRLGHDFSDVKIHTDSGAAKAAQAVNARAFTVGKDVVFGAGQYAPGTDSGKRLLAHELSHVVQQSEGVRLKQPLKSEQKSSSHEIHEERNGKREETPAQFIEQPDENRNHADVEIGTDKEVSRFPDLKIDTSLNSAQVPEFEIAATGGLEFTDISIGPEMPTAEPSMDIEASDSESSVPSLQAKEDIIQREDDDSGFLGSIRKRISNTVDGLRSGWSSLSQLAQGAFDSIRNQVGSMTGGLQNFVSSAVSGIQSSWTALSQTTTQLTNGIKQQLQGALGEVTGVARSIAQAIVSLDAKALSAAWGRITGLIGGVWQRLQQAGQAVFQRITGLWNGLRDRFNGVLGSLANRARDIFNRLQAAAQGLRQRMASAWAALRNRASQMSGVLGGILERLRSLVSHLISWGQQIWNGIQQQWSTLSNRVDGILQQVRQRITAVKQGLHQQAMNIWNRLLGLWSRLQGWVRQQVQRIVHSIRSTWDNILHLNIGQIIEAITRYAPFLRAVHEVVQNPDIVMLPIAQNITSQLQTGMPAAAEQKAREHTAGRNSSSQSADISTGDVVVQRQTNPSSGQTVMMRQPLDQDTLWSGFWEVLVDKWHQTNILALVLDFLYTMVWPWPAVGREWDGLKSDLERVVTRMKTAGLGFWRHLIDIPLIIWRRVNNILLNLYGWFLLLSMAIGAIAGGVGGTVGGAILGFLAGGAPAAPGAAGGAGVGIAGGAGIGLGFALGVGEGLLASFVAAEFLSLFKAWADLSFVEQTEDEQAEDLDQMVNSGIGVGIAAVLYAISALVGGLIRSFLSKIKLGGAAQRFIQGVHRGFRRGSPFRRTPKAEQSEHHGCFIAGTKIFTHRGLQPIEFLTIGDEVCSSDPRSGKKASHHISQTLTRIVPVVLEIRVDSTIITCSPDHPFWIPHRGFQKAGTLKPGTPLLTVNSKEIRIDSIQRRQGSFVVFNIEVEGLHTYHVSELGILVHNKAEKLRTRYGWIDSPEWKAAVREVKGGGTLEAVRGKVPTQLEGEMLIDGAGGSIERIHAGHLPPNPHTYPHINYYTPKGVKATLRIQEVMSMKGGKFD